MNRQEYDLVVVGGGPAGLAAAQSAYDHGIKDIAILERDFELGGILTQCIHHGFGLHYYNEELTGPEYAQRFINNIKERDIDIKLDTMVLEVTKDKQVYAVNSEEGMLEIDTQAVILAMGCRERTRDVIDVPGYRSAGVFTAGTAQRYTNIEGKIPGEKIVILGSGDIGLIPEDELSKEAGLEMHPVTGGPIVDEGRETNIEGIYACGNVLHVHDLVDWVTEESMMAGKTAAQKLQGKVEKREQEIKVKPGVNVSYVVPQTIANKDQDRKRVDLYLRVKQPMKNVTVNLMEGSKKLFDKQKRRVEPGEMITFPVPEQILKDLENNKFHLDIKKQEG